MTTVRTGQVRGILAERVAVSTTLDPFLSLRALVNYSGLWRRHVVSSPTLIDDWLLTIEQRRRRRRLALANQTPPKA